MAVPNSRSTFKEYCLRKLGAPVIRIDCADVQVEDRIDDAIQTWQEKHYDATEYRWLAYKVSQEDLDNGYVTVPDSFLVVDRVMKMSSVTGGTEGRGPDYNLSFSYQFVMSNLSPFQPLDTLNYYLTMTSLNEMDDMLNAQETFVFTKHLNKLNMYNTFQSRLKPDDFIFMRVALMLPDEATKVWNDKWLKEYATALIKRQWASNISKFEQVQLLGGVTLNGQRLYDEALAEIEKLEATLEDTYQEPINFFIG